MRSHCGVLYGTYLLILIKAITFITTLAANYATMNISSTWILSPLYIKSKTYVVMSDSIGLE